MDNAIDKWIADRTEFKEKVASMMVEGQDYYIIHGRKSLSKGGAEKISSLFKWSASFEKDTDVLSVLDQTADKYIAFICNLAKADQSPAGQGRGAASLKANHGDVNKWIKMAQKSAFIDAVLRASGLSDSYTQDLEDMDPSHIGDTPDRKPVQSSFQPSNSSPSSMSGGTIKPSPKQMQTITDVMDRNNITLSDIIDAGFPPLTELTGGREGTASELIDWLFKQKKQPFKDTPTQQRIIPQTNPVDEIDVSDIPF